MLLWYYGIWVADWKTVKTKTRACNDVRNIYLKNMYLNQSDKNIYAPQTILIPAYFCF